MDEQQIPLKEVAARLAGAVRYLVKSEVGGKAKLIFAGLFVMLCGVNGLNVLNSYVGRNFMSAIADRQTSEFVRQAIFYTGVFASLTLVSVIARFAEERLGLLWREVLTRNVVALYLANTSYYRLDAAHQLTNPDQRIAEDIKAFTSTTLTYVLMVFNSSLTLLSFAGVLWAIDPALFVVAMLYAACGTLLTLIFGRPLIRLNYDQLDKEANFRSALIHVRENAESIMLARDEGHHQRLLFNRVDQLVANLRRIVGVNRNLSFFTTGYNWMIQIIPALIVAPAYMRGEVEFGVITQSAAAFAMLVSAFSLIVTQFNSISNFAAVVARLGSLVEAFERSKEPTPTEIEIIERDACLAYQGLTLLSSSGVPLLKDLSASISPGAVVLLTGSGQLAGTTLFRATAGLPTSGSGRIIRPAPAEITFLAQRPYLPPGTLRQILVPRGDASKISDGAILHLLHELGLEQVVSEAGGLDKEQEWWGASLSLSDQQLLALARIFLAPPRFAFLDRVAATLGPEQFAKALRMLSERSIACIHNGDVSGGRELFNAVLEYADDGGWTWTPNRA
ncbi:SbmA/BacA-like family transporter [Mesorhizobium sp. BAC0120]|uniref:ABC transporter ATP-binding protein/permease n=1 Tax=Mesorhizobium sp. BAC0120 TaxID=3090670 RepID=UPI00298CA57F|nr:SbmA/BacA-like family transporter [Mesorhizobium sp. BAC0120]MDW6024028.1 SbmA/BacA-like family transporter [Mesorhizobium sp. BAC0120]